VRVGRPVVLIAIAGAALGVGLRIWVLRSHLGAVDSDEAVVGLLAKGILHGRLPAFFPGQGYGGTQEEFLAAPLIALFGLSATTIRAAPLALWVASVVLVWLIGRRVLDDRRAVLASVVFWVWPAYFIWKSTRAHGFYGSELTLGLVVLWLILRLHDKRSLRDLVFLGLALGCGLWSSPQVAIVALPSLCWLVWTRRSLLRDAPVVLAFAVVGALPWLLGNLRRDWYSLHPGANEGPWTNHVHNLVVSTLPEALGLRLAWSYEWVGGVAVGLPVYALAVGGFGWLLMRHPSRLTPLLLIVLTFPVFYIVSPYTWLQTEPRYLTLVMPVFALLIASAMTTAWRTAAILTVVVAISIGGMIELDRHHVVAFSTEGTAVPASITPVLDTLRAHHLSYAFASYWIAWRIAFESDEKIIGAKASWAHPYIRNGRVQPGDPANDRGFDSRYYSRADRQRQVGHVFVLGGNAEPRVRPLLRRAGYRRIVTGGFSVWIPPAS
jgi:hypothetical protein